MKRILACLLVILMVLSGLCSCAERGEEGGELLVICTSFSWYDWAREIVGESEGVTLRLLTDGGKDMHSYTPSAADMMAILSCDLLVYGGGVSEVWIGELAKEGKLRAPLSLMEVLGEDVKCLTEHEHGEGEAHVHSDVDEHIWLSLRNAVRFCESIKDALCRLDEANAEIYEKNCAAYTQRLTALDGAFAALVERAERDEVVVADRYPYRYLFEDHGIVCHAAFEGCSTESEAGITRVIELSETFAALAPEGILVTETSDGRLAKTVLENASSEAEILVLHSLQTVADSAAVSYLSLMEENLRVLEKVLG